MATVVLTLLGTDRAGLVSAVSQLITEQGGSWERSQMAHLAGALPGIAGVDGPPAQRTDGASWPRGRRCWRGVASTGRS